MSYQHRIRLSDTDAAGRIYFTSAFNWAQASLEDFLAAIGYPVGKLLKESPFILPVVRAEADYRASPSLGELMTVTTRVENIGNTSIRFRHDIATAEGTVVIVVATTHATVSRKSGRAIAVPAALRKALRS